MCSSPPRAGPRPIPRRRPRWQRGRAGAAARFRSEWGLGRGMSSAQPERAWKFNKFGTAEIEVSPHLLWGGGGRTSSTAGCVPVRSEGESRAETLSPLPWLSVSTVLIRLNLHRTCQPRRPWALSSLPLPPSPPSASPLTTTASRTRCEPWPAPARSSCRSPRSSLTGSPARARGRGPARSSPRQRRVPRRPSCALSLRPSRQWRPVCASQRCMDSRCRRRR